MRFTLTLLVVVAVLVPGCGDGNPSAGEVPRDASPASSPTARVQESAVSQKAKLARDPNSKRWALLIGCGEYTRPIPQLRGPANDLELIKGLLAKFGYSDGDIRSLSDALGKSDWPTRANIEREFERLTENVKQGDQVFIMLAGHGSQQPDLDHDTGVDHEPDGLDEIFLPRDAGRWIPGQTVENAIVDDELRNWLTRLVKRGAFVVFVADTCCSGTAARGDTDEGLTARFVDAFSVLGVPPVDAPLQSRGGSNSSPQAEDWLDVATAEKDGRGVVAVYASQSDQKEWELAIGGAIHGQLCYMLFRILDESRSPVTWRDVARRLRYEYSSKRWDHRSLPGVEGTDLDRSVFSLDQWPVPSAIALTASNSEWEISQGLLHGISPGTVLAVRNPAGSEDVDTILGYLRAQHCEPLRASVEPVAFNGRDKNTRLSGLFRCEIVLRKTDDIRVRVVVQHEGFSVEQNAEAARSQLQAVLKTIAARRGSLAQLTERRADWYVVVTPAGCWLQRSGSQLPLRSDVPDTTGQRFGPFPLDESLEPVLENYLTQVARAENLIRLSDMPTSEAGQLVNVEVDVERKGTRLDVDALQGVELHDKDRIRLTIRNTGQTSIAVRVFYVESQYAIQPFFPRLTRAAADQRRNNIPPGAMLNADPPIEFDINALTTGPENLIVVAVPVTDANLLDELSLLTQPGPGKNTRAAGVNFRPQSPLGQFLDAMVRNTRGAALTAVPDETRYSIKRIGWNVAAPRQR